MPATIIVAIISGVISLISLYIAYSNSLKKSKFDARLDYEYEARKKLYQEYEPLFFKLIEYSEFGYFRIRGMAERASEGKLGQNGWLSHKDYYWQSTIYYLFAPIAVCKLIKSKINFVDVSVDPHVYATYIIGKILFLSFSEAFAIADVNKMPYNPFDKKADGTVDNRQDIPIGITENLVDALSEPEGSVKIKSLGSFQEFCQTPQFDDWFLDQMLLDFHPATRPVFWRVLIVQAFIYNLIIALKRSRNIKSINDLTTLIDTIKIPEIENFDWRSEQEKKAGPDASILQPIECARAYVKKRVTEFY